MCVVSMVHDSYTDKLPWVEPYVPPEAERWAKHVVGTYPLGAPIDFNKLREMIDEFRALIEAAKFIDSKLSQPDCLDPEKAKLEEKITQLEAVIAQPTEFVLVKGGNFEPGTYRVIDGKLFKVCE
jgi:hypothetical protein